MSEGWVESSMGRGGMWGGADMGVMWGGYYIGNVDLFTESENMVVKWEIPNDRRVVE